MKKKISILAVLALTAAMIIFSCTREKTTEEKPKEETTKAKVEIIKVDIFQLADIIGEDGAEKVFPGRLATERASKGKPIKNIIVVTNALTLNGTLTGTTASYTWDNPSNPNFIGIHISPALTTAGIVDVYAVGSVHPSWYAVENPVTNYSFDIGTWTEVHAIHWGTDTNQNVYLSNTKSLP